MLDMCNSNSWFLNTIYKRLEFDWAPCVESRALIERFDLNKRMNDATFSRLINNLEHSWDLRWNKMTREKHVS